jgi:hypothetical protein
MAVCLLAAGPARAAVGPGRAATVFGDISFNVSPFYQDPGFHGYAEYQVRIANRAAHVTHEVKLTLPHSGWSRNAFLGSVTCTVRVAPASEKVVSLFQPALPLGGYDVEVAIDGRRQSNWIDLKGVERQNTGPNYTESFLPRVLVSASLHNGFQGNLHKADFVQPIQRQAPTGTFTTGIQVISKQAKAWSERWLGYSSYDEVVLTSGELKSLGPNVQTALWRYVECGGSLVIVGPWKNPLPWKGTATTLVEPLPPAQGVPLRSHSAGFGQCIVSPETDLSKLDPAQWRHIAEAWTRTGRRWEQQQVATVTGANRVFPVIEDLTTPVRSLFLVMVLFAITIGPLNLFVLSRRQRKIWLLWTVPAISLLTSGGVLGYMFWREGWQGHVRVEGVTVLNETTGRATTLGWIAFYTPLTPGDGLHFGPDTELTPLLRGGPETRGVLRSTRTIDWSDDKQHLAAGWVTARLPAHFMVRKSEIRPERVTVRRAKDGSLGVTNRLGVAIHQLWYADHRGKIFTAADIPTSGRAMLKPAADAAVAAGNPQLLRQAYGLNWLQIHDVLTRSPQLSLRPGCSIATLEDAPFIEPGLRQAEFKGRSVVYIIHRESADAH